MFSPLPVDPMTAEEETLIETYVRRPGALDASTRQQAQALVAEDSEAAAWATVLRSTYEVFDAMSETVPRVVDRFVDTLFDPPTRVPLTPMDQARPTMLSADTGKTGSFESLAVLSSRANGVLVRILRDTKRNEGRVYVLARDEQAYRDALFESGDERLQVPLTAGGFGRFANASDVPAEALTSGRLRRCLWRGPIVPGETPTDRLHVAEGYVVRTEWADSGTLTLHTTTRNANRPALRWASIDDGDAVEMIRFDDQTATVTLPFDHKERTLRLFG